MNDTPDIKALRERLDWSVERMADWCGVTTKRIYQLEKGQGVPSGPLQKLIDQLYDHLDRVA